MIPSLTWFDIAPPALAFTAVFFVLAWAIGISLAGHIVEEVSGVPFARYVEENITGPLGMDSTTFDQPPAGALEGLAQGG